MHEQLHLRSHPPRSLWVSYAALPNPFPANHPSSAVSQTLDMTRWCLTYCAASRMKAAFVLTSSPKLSPALMRMTPCYLFSSKPWRTSAPNCQP